MSVPRLAGEDVPTDPGATRASEPVRRRRPSWRRLSVMTVTTGLLVEGTIAEPTWLAVALVFVLGDAAERISENLRPWSQP